MTTEWKKEMKKLLKMTLLVATTLMTSPSHGSGDFKTNFAITVKEADFGSKTYSITTDFYKQLETGISCIPQIRRELKDNTSRSAVRSTLKEFALMANTELEQTSIDFYFVTDREIRDTGEEFFRPHRLVIYLKGSSWDEIRKGKANNASFSLILNDNGTCDVERVFNLLANQTAPPIGESAGTSDPTYINDVPAEEFYRSGSDAIVAP